MDTIPVRREASWCESSKKHRLFQPVASFSNLGVVVMRYLGDMDQKMAAIDDAPVITHDPDPKSNIFIIINTSNNNFNSEDLLPAFDIDKITCPRCRNRAERVQKMLKSNIKVDKRDILGICDHCKGRNLSPTPCDVCEQIVKKFLDVAKVKAIGDILSICDHCKNAHLSLDTTKFKATAKYSYEQKISHVLRPITRKRPKRLEILPPTKDLNIELIMQPKPRTERKTDKYLEKHVVIDKPKEELKIVELSSDESVLTTFITTFSQDDKKKGDKSFKYIFPQDSKKEERIKSTVPTSAELLTDMQDKIQKYSKEETKQDVQKIKFYKSDYDKDYTEKQFKETIQQDEEIRSTDNIREFKQKIGIDKIDIVGTQRELKKNAEDGLKPLSKDIIPKKDKADLDSMLSKDFKTKKAEEVMESPSKRVIAKKAQSNVERPPEIEPKKGKETKKDIEQKSLPPPSPLSKVIESKKGIKDEVSPPPKDIESKKAKKDVEPPLPKDVKPKKDKIDVGPKDVKSRKVKEDERPSPSKEVKPKKEKVDTEPPPSPPKDVKPKKDKVDAGPPPPPPPKDVRSKKDKVDAGPPPPPKDVKPKEEKVDAAPPKDGKSRKVKEDERPSPSKEVKPKKEKVDTEPPPSPPKDVRSKKDKVDAGPPPPPKDVKPKKETVDAVPPSPKDVKPKKEKIDAAPPKDGKSRNVKEDERPSPSKEVKPKKEKVDTEPPPSPPKDVKPKKDKVDAGPPPPPPKDVRSKKEKVDAVPPSPKDVKPKKEKVDAAPPSPKDDKPKKDKKDVGLPPMPDVKTKKYKEEEEPKLSKGKPEKSKEIKTPPLTPPPQPPKDAKEEKSKKDVKPQDIKEKEDAKVKKGKEAVTPPSAKYIATEKKQESLGPRPSKVIKAKKDQGDTVELTKGKAKKVKDDIELPQPKKDIKIKEGKKDLKQPRVDDEKTKEIKDKQHKTTQVQETDIERKKNQETKDVKASKKDNLSKKVMKQKEKEEDTEKVEIKDKTKDKKKDREKDEKSDKQKAGTKDKLQDGIKDEEVKKSPAPKNEPLTIYKLLPVQKPSEKMMSKAKTTGDEDKIANKALALRQAIEEEALKIQEKHAMELEKARLKAVAKFGLKGVQGGEYYIFKIALKQSFIEIKRTPRKKKTVKHLDIKRFKIRQPSYDDSILKLVKLTKFKRAKGEKKMRKHEKKYRIRPSRWHYLNLSIDSDMELDIESFTNIIKSEIVRHKIKHTSIVRNVEEKPKPKLQPDPIIFHTVQDISEPIKVIDLEEEVPKEQLPTPTIMGTKGIIRFKLSDHSFIEKGWTKLPTEKIVRQMNVYKVRPTNPEYDWFDHNRTKGSLQYATGEKMAQFDEDGRGRWYYRNGKLALDYYDCEDANARQRFVIYSDGESYCDLYRTHSVTVLAMFDYLGNGVVFDHNGKIRLKYNQTEGVILDRNVSPYSRWKWHNLNDPPVLKKVMIDTNLEPPDPKIMKMRSGDDSERTRIQDEEMLAIELDNLVKEKAKKLKEKYQPYQIKMKALRINEQFSLKILDQAHVYLNFREGSVNIKLNLGMVLESTEMIDTDMADFGDVENVLERFPPKTDSLLDLQNVMRQTRLYNRLCTERALKIRPQVPQCSADRLVSALSKPMRRPPLTVGAQPCSNSNIKRSHSNLYYDTRLI